LQNKLEISYKKLENRLDKLETSHRELKESNGKLQKDIEIKFEKLRENVKRDLKTETEKLIQRFDLTSENKVEEISNQERTDFILRRQGERVEQIQLQTNQASVLDQDQNSSVECVQVLETEHIESSSESQIVKLSNPEQTEIILRRKGEHAEQNSIEEICIENSDSGGVKTKEIMAKCKEVSSAPHIPYVEKESVNGPSMPKASTKTEIVGVKESRANSFASYIIESNISNDSQKVLFLSDENSEMFHSRHINEFLQISVPTRNSSNKLEHQGSKRSKSRYRHCTDIILCIRT
jgi:hypothetical protein